MIYSTQGKKAEEFLFLSSLVPGAQLLCKMKQSTQTIAMFVLDRMTKIYESGLSVAAADGAM